MHTRHLLRAPSTQLSASTHLYVCWTSYHADVVAVEQDLRHLGFAINRVTVIPLAQTQLVDFDPKIRSHFRDVLEYHVCAPC